MATSYTKLAEASSATDATSYTFSALPMGANGTIPKFVRVMGRAVGNSIPSRVTIGGVALTRIVQQSANTRLTNASTLNTSIWAGVINLTGNQDVVVEFTEDGNIGGVAATQFRAGIEVGEADVSLTAFDTASTTSETAAGTTTIDVPEDGLVLAIAGTGSSTTGTAHSQTNLPTRTTALAIESNAAIFVCAHEQAAAAATGRTVGISIDAGGTNLSDYSMVAASFSPSSAPPADPAVEHVVAYGGGTEFATRTNAQVVTPNFTPPDNRLLVAIFSAVFDATTPTEAGFTISGGGLTWTKQLYHKTTAASGAQQIGIVWTAPVTTGASMAITINHDNTGYAFTTNETRLLSVEAIGDPDLASLIGATASLIGAGAAAADLTLNAAPSADSVVIGFTANVPNTGAAMTAVPGAGWTELSDIARAGWAHLQVQARVGDTGTNVHWDDVASDAVYAGHSIAVAFEVKRSLTSTPATGTLAVTLDDATAAASGKAIAKGLMNVASDDATLAAAGVARVAGALAVTLEDATMVAEGEQLPPGASSGTLAVTLDDATLAASGAVRVAGALTATLEDASVEAAGATLVVGALAVTLDEATMHADGLGQVRGTLTATLDDATLTGAGAARVTGALNVTLEDAVLQEPNGSIGSLNVTLDNATVEATGRVRSRGTLSVTLDNAVVIAEGVAPVEGALSATLDDATLAADGRARARGLFNIVADNATMVAVGSAPSHGTLNVTLDDAVLVANAQGEILPAAHRVGRSIHQPRIGRAVHQPRIGRSVV